VFIQSFETANLRQLAGMTRAPLVQLIDASGAPHDFALAGDPPGYRDLTSREGLAGVATYADAVGVHKSLVLPRTAAVPDGEPSDLVADAHEAGLQVHVWTLRDENQFLAPSFRRGADPNAKGDGYVEAMAFLDAGVDGIFTDHPDTTVMALEDWLAAADQPA
jgi:glycerophosphoryl diester phosphodiesterase